MKEILVFVCIVGLVVGIGIYAGVNYTGGEYSLYVGGIIERYETKGYTLEEYNPNGFYEKEGVDCTLLVFVKPLPPKTGVTYQQVVIYVDEEEKRVIDTLYMP